VHAKPKISMRTLASSDVSALKPSTAADLKAKLEDLRVRFEQKSAKLVEREGELEAAKREALELRRFFQETGAKNRSVVPSDIRAGLGRASSTETELQRVLMWLAEHVRCEESVAFNACCDLVVADQHIQIRNIVQWCLVDGLRLSVPEEFASEISNLLSAVKASSPAVASLKAKALADEWTLTQCEDGTASVMTLLTHRESQSTCLVADFPVPPPPSPAYCKRWAGVSVGDYVEVNFKGQWFTGTVCFIQESGLTYVHCDVDPPDVMTAAPIHKLRRPRGASPLPEEARNKEAFSHAR